MADEQYADAIALLKADHRTVEELFEKFSKAKDDESKRALAAQICTELKIHATIEEEIFYPPFEGKIDENLYKEAYVEHDGAKVLINDIVANCEEDEFFEAKVTVLCEEITHHVEEEEKPGEGYFYQARQTDVDLVALRDAMLARKQELTALAESEGLPAAQPTAVNVPA